jgi:sugar lactone lactonase YvrE
MRTRLLAKCAMAIICASLLTGSANAAQPNVMACPTSSGGHGWGRAETLVPPSPFNGVHGLVMDNQNRLIAASLFGGQLWRVDKQTGAATVLVDRPDGQADDVAIGPKGEMAWTSLLEGKIRFRESEAAPIRVIASSLPFINSIRFDPRNGRLYAAQVFGADALWEIAPKGDAPPRLIARDLGGLNGFDIGKDGMIYGPLTMRGSLVRIDPVDGRTTVVATGFAAPNGVKIDAEGDLWAVDGGNGQLVHVDLRTGVRTVKARFPAILDNLAIGRGGEIYVSDGARDAIQVYTPMDGKVRALEPPRVAIPAGLAISNGQLWVADGFALRTVDLTTGAVREHYREIAAPFPFTVSMSHGRLAMSSTFLKAVGMFDATSGRSLGTVQGVAMPSDAIILEDGGLLVSDYDRGELVRAEGADLAQRAVVATGLNGPVQMTAGGDGHVYVVTRDGKLVDVSLKGARATRTIVSGLVHPEGLAATTWGTLVIAEVGRRRLIEIDPATGRLLEIAHNLPIGLTVKSSLPDYAIPTGVAVDGDGTIYMSADMNNAIYRFRPCQGSARRAG